MGKLCTARGRWRPGRASERGCVTLSVRDFVAAAEEEAGHQIESSRALARVVIAALAMEAAMNHHTTTIPIMLVLSLLGFAGSLSMARFVADRDKAKKWDVPTSPPTHSERGGEGT